MRKIFKRFASLLTIFILTIMSIVPVHASENTSVVNDTDGRTFCKGNRRK